MTARLQHILFYGTTADPVCSALGSFRTGGRRLLSADASSDAFIRVYREDNNWVVAEPTESALVDLANEWELSRRRELYLFVSKVLWCSGFFVFISDWGYWGYEFFANGQVLDHFLQEENEDYAPAGLRAADCSGNIALLMKHFPFLEASS